MTLTDKQQSLIDDLNLIADPHERLSAVVAKAAGQSLPEDLKNEDNRVPGCVSRVWLVGAIHGGRCMFRCDAESPMVKGLVALLCDLYSNATPEEVGTVEPEVWTQSGLDRLLSPTRMNGLNAVRVRMRELASRLQTSTPAVG